MYLRVCTCNIFQILTTFFCLTLLDNFYADVEELQLSQIAVIYHMPLINFTYKGAEKAGA